MLKVSSRGLALIIAGLALILVAFGSLVQTFSTDAAWTDEKTASGSFRQAQFDGEPEIIIPGKVTNPRCDASGGPSKTVTLTWGEPANLVGKEVVYEVAWRVAGSTEVKLYEVNTGVFVPNAPDLEPTNPAPDHELTVRAKIAGQSELGPAAVFRVKGPLGNGLFTCIGKVEFSALAE